MFEEILAKVGTATVFDDLSKMPAWEPTEFFSIDIETYGEGGKPGSVVKYSGHGIHGIAMATLSDAAYFPVKHYRQSKGVDLKELINYLNLIWFNEDRICFIHYSKFDLGFLLFAGLKLGRTRIWDTWKGHSILARGKTMSHELKEIARKNGHDTGSEEKIEKFFDERETRDFADLPLETISVYACDDVRFTLFEGMTQQSRLSDRDRYTHDTFMTTERHLIGAEWHGFAIDRELLRERHEQVDRNFEIYKKEMERQLFSQEIDPDDDQAVMANLHQSGFHSAKRELYGRCQYHFDREFLAAARWKSELASTFYFYYQLKKFREYYKVRARLFDEGPNLVYLPSFMCSIASKGGLPLATAPHFNDELFLDNSLRSLVVPRKGKRLVYISAYDIPTILLAFYAGDREMQAAYYNDWDTLDFVHKRTEIDRRIVSLALRQMFEGSGMGLLERRLKLASELWGLRWNSTKRGHYTLRDKIVASFAGWEKFEASVKARVLTRAYLSDRLDRPLMIDPEKDWRACSILVQVSYGAIVGFFLDLFCRFAANTGANLVFVNKHEFLFEAPNNDFFTLCDEATAKEWTKPMPMWSIENVDRWKCETDESYDDTWNKLIFGKKTK